MITISEVSRLTGISVRTLHYYDEIHLLTPSAVTNAGYRLYDDAALQTLQQILLLRELEFPLRQIRNMLQNPKYNRFAALDEQLVMLNMKREHIDGLIELIQKVKEQRDFMDFNAFCDDDFKKYSDEAKARWQSTGEYAEFEKKTKGYSSQDWDAAAGAMKSCFEKLGTLRGHAPGDPEVQVWVRSLQETISHNFYPCSDEVLRGLGQMYTGDPRFKGNIDDMCGAGTAEFAAAAIAAYCAK